MMKTIISQQLIKNGNVMNDYKDQNLKSAILFATLVICIVVAAVASLIN